MLLVSIHFAFQSYLNLNSCYRFFIENHKQSLQALFIACYLIYTLFVKHFVIFFQKDHKEEANNIAGGK